MIAPKRDKIVGPSGPHSIHCACIDPNDMLDKRARNRAYVAGLEAEVDALRTRLIESEAENDQWQKKLAETWAEIERLKERA